MNNREEVSREDAVRTGKICIRWGGPGKVFPEEKLNEKKSRGRKLYVCVCVCVCGGVGGNGGRLEV